jgi:hypothetical protein
MMTDFCYHFGDLDRRWSRAPLANLDGGYFSLGFNRIYVGSLAALWFENPHQTNEPLYRPRQSDRRFVFVPVLDPTIATWRDELDHLMKAGPVPMVRLFPNYHGYPLSEADPLLAELARRKVVAQVIVRMEDPRRQHRLAQVPDVPAESVRDAAGRHPGLNVLLSGAQGATLLTMSGRLPSTRNLWADTSQADGLGTIPDLMKSAWGDRLVFGSHYPLFIPYAAVARVVLDLDDATTMRIFEGNASSLVRSGE